MLKLSEEDLLGRVFRHKRLFNYVVTPIKIDGRSIECKVGKGMVQIIPSDYFKRDWKEDPKISLEELDAKLNELPDETPYTFVFNEYFEEDDGNEHSYIHFDDLAIENVHHFPSWKITTCTKSERDDLINPFTLIMPIRDNLVKEAQEELDIMNEIRAENEFIEFEDFKGFEFGLIKLLEKKYLRDI